MSTHPFYLIFKNKLNAEELTRLLKRTQTILEPDGNYIGYLSFQDVYVWVYKNDDINELDEKKEEITEMLGNPPQFYIVLDASTRKRSVSYQIVYDFAYVCIEENYHCILQDFTGDLISEKEIIEVSTDRAIDNHVPPPLLTKRREEGNIK